MRTTVRFMFLFTLLLGSSGATAAYVRSQQEPPEPQRCITVDFNTYDPERNEDPAISWGWEK